MPHRITSLLVSKHETQQVEIVLRLDWIAAQLQRLASSSVRQIAAAAQEGGDLIHVYQEARRILHALPNEVRQRLANELHELVRKLYRRNGRIIAHSLPIDYLRHMTLRKIRRSPLQRGRVMEDTPTAPRSVVDLALDALGLGTTQHLDPLQEPARQELSIEEQRRIFERLLFPPPPEEWVNEVLRHTVQGQPWYQALSSAQRAAEFGPDRLASTIASDYAQGKGQQEIADNIKPFVDGLGWRAARVARTYGLAIAGHVQQHMHDELGELMVGKVIRATLDERTRPAHRARNGTLYHKQPDGSYLSDEPVPGPPGKMLREMPEPPVEGDGSLSWNCR